MKLRIDKSGQSRAGKPQLVLALLVLSQASLAADLTGKVVSIADGDTFTLLTPQKEQVKIRLAEIDAPESGQPYGNRSKQALSEMVFGKEVRVVVGLGTGFPDGLV